MHRSPDAAGPTAARNTSPEACQFRRSEHTTPRGSPQAPPRGSFHAPAREACLKRPGFGANSVRTTELRELMEEPAGGPNFGRTVSTDPEGDGGRHVPLGVEETQTREFAREGGFTSVTDVPGTEGRGGGWQRAGGTTHRGVLHPNEYVDHEALVAAVEAELGFSFDEVHAVYRQGRLSNDQRELRERIDARLLALSRSGANMHLLGRVLGFKTTGDTLHRALKNALTRARAAEAV